MLKDKKKISFTTSQLKIIHPAIRDIEYFSDGDSSNQFACFDLIKMSVANFGKKYCPFYGKIFRNS